MTTNKVKIVHSMVFKVQVLLVTAMVSVIAIMLGFSLPRTQKNMQSVSQSYMLDEVKAYGTYLSTAVTADTTILENNTFLSKMLGDVKVENKSSSYAYLVDANGIMLYHPTAEKIGQAVENTVVSGLVSDIAAGNIADPACVEYDYNGTTKYAAYYINSTGDFILVITADEADIFSDITDMRNTMIFTALVALIILQLVGAVITNKMLRPLHTLTNIVNKSADLDFTENAELESLTTRKDEIGKICKSVGNLQTELIEIISSIQEQSTHVAEASVDFRNKFSEIAESISNVNIAVEEIAQGSTSQAQETTAANEQVVRMGDAIEVNGQSVDDLEHSINTMNELADTANAMLTDLVEINTKTSKNISVVFDQTNLTNESAVKIKEALTLIQDITQQTSLLSLNASIEAARAGELGKGFSVVAEEIRKLSEASERSAEEIDHIVKELIDNSDDNVSKMEELMVDAKVQYNKLNDTKESFGSLKTEVNAVSLVSQHIFEQTEKLETLKNEVHSVVEQLAAIAQEDAASTQETSASMQTLSITLEDCKNETAILSTLSEELNEQMNKFTF